MEKIEKEIQTRLIEAMKEKNENKLEAYRLIKSEIQNEKTNGSFHEVTDSDVIKIIRKIVKQKAETEEMYKNGGRVESAEKEKIQRELLEEFLPKQMDEKQIEIEISSIIKEINATSVKDTGKIMSAFNSKFPNMADGKVVGGIVRKLLT